MTRLRYAAGDGAGDVKDAEWYARRYQEAARRIVELESEMAERLQRHTAEAAAERGEVGRLQEELASQADELRALAVENGVLRDRVRQLESEIDRLTRQVDQQGAELQTMLDSRSWRATRLIREFRWLVFPPQGGEADPTRTSARGRSKAPRSRL